MVVGGGGGSTHTDPISGPSSDFTFTIGPELDNTVRQTDKNETS